MNHRRLIILMCSALGCMLWIWRVDAAWGDELDQCISAAKKTNLSCWNRCDDDDRNCIADCDADFEARKQQCRANVRANASGDGDGDAGKAPLSGATKTGQGGCYFGECPPDLDKRIEASADEEEPPQHKPQRRPQPEEEPAQRQTFPPPAQVQMTRICQTPGFWCMMYVAGPVNSPCWCASAFGPANGITIPER